MERDNRRAHGQWRGCHSFKDIICDGDQAATHKRDGGLRMGQTYYYYYELNGSTETHDPSMPSTNTCPFLPGQTVNTLHVPEERSERKRSASLNELRKRDYMTMNPDDKFITPRAAPPAPTDSSSRVGTAPVMLSRERSTRSVSPNPSRPWSAKRLFRMRSKERGRDRSQSISSVENSDISSQFDDQSSPLTAETSRSRDISPDALHRFLSNDIPKFTPQDTRPAVTIPEDIAEEIEDDDNFATSAASETAPFPTILSPPPFQRSSSSNSIATATAQTPKPSIDTLQPSLQDPPMIDPTPTLPAPPKFQLGLATSHFSISSSESEPESPSTPNETDGVTFYDSSEEEEDDDDDATPSIDAEVYQQTKPLFSTYSLPRTACDERIKTAEKVAPISSPAVIAGDMPTGNTSFLTSPVDEGVDDLMSELGWMVDVIRANGI